MMNAYQTQLDQIVCITQIRCLLFDSNLKEQSAKPILDNKFIDGVQVFEIGLEDFLICCQVNDRIFKEKIDNVIDLKPANQSDYNSLVFRAKRSEDNTCFVFEDLKQQSMLLR